MLGERGHIQGGSVITTNPPKVYAPLKIKINLSEKISIYLSKKVMNMLIMHNDRGFRNKIIIKQNT